jgi:hypothetical protein
MIAMTTNSSIKVKPRRGLTGADWNLNFFIKQLSIPKKGNGCFANT